MRCFLFILSIFYDDKWFNEWQSEGHRQILTKELEAVGLRLNKRPPQVSGLAQLTFVPIDFEFLLPIFLQIYFRKKKTGGISFNSTLALSHIDEKLCYQILHEYKIHNAEVSSL